MMYKHVDCVIANSIFLYNYTRIIFNHFPSVAKNLSLLYIPFYRQQRGNISLNFPRNSEFMNKFLIFFVCLISVVLQLCTNDVPGDTLVCGRRFETVKTSL